MGLFTGAGISVWPPAGIPLGRDLEERLHRCCFEAAAAVAPDVAGPGTLAIVFGVRRNIVARLAVCAGVPTVTALLRSFRVAVPNEGHMLAAAHAARGALHVTVNFDDGVEVAYGLLSGQLELPADVPGDVHDALAEWRRAVRPAAPLPVVASRFADAGLEQRPLLVKLRGSEEEGWQPNLVPAGPDRDVDAHGLTEDQVVPLRMAARVRGLVIAGISGADADYRTALLPLLRRGRFSWTTASLDTSMIDLIRRIDPSQPSLRPGVEGLRAALPSAARLPAWPTVTGRPSNFELQFSAWRARLPLHAAAETYAWLLAESGLGGHADAVRRAIVANGGTLQAIPRAAVR
jgi:hypothetical protein